MTQERPLSEKEQRVAGLFDAVKPGLGKVMERIMREPDSGWTKYLDATSDAEIAAAECVAERLREGEPS